MKKLKKLQIKYLPNASVEHLILDIEKKVENRRGISYDLVKEMTEKMHHCATIDGVLKVAKDYFDVTAIKL